MHLDPLYIQVLPRLSATGSSELISDVMPLKSIDIGVRHFDLFEGIAYDVNLTNTGEAILLSGTAQAQLKTQCDKCLEPTVLSIKGEVQGYFLFDASTADDGKSLEIYEEVDRNGMVDIASSLLAAIVVELPTVTLCAPDCTGIGIAGSETGESDDAQEAIDEFENPESPFAVLKDFKFEE